MVVLGYGGAPMADARCRATLRVELKICGMGVSLVDVQNPLSRDAKLSQADTCAAATHRAES